MNAPHTLGAEGERIAARYLAGKGYRILERNFRFMRNEIDIIAADGREICFIEVKTRASLDKGHPAEAVTPRKQKEIIRAASGYISRLDGPPPDCRFDVIAILARGLADGSIIEFGLEHIQSAFMA
ncbi:MAG: YraN family protein [Chlorobiaceae bacterium]|nr:YraN family protein [Chlorobiaceae bacterium]